VPSASTFPVQFAPRIVTMPAAVAVDEHAALLVRLDQLACASTPTTQMPA